jgi:hypothetical protein
MTTRLLGVLLTLTMLVSPSFAEAPAAEGGGLGLALAIEGDETLARAAHASIPVIVSLPSGADHPLLLTPSVEGSAVELVRGRLTRADAKNLDPQHLRFELPVVAKSEGTAILRVEVMTYACSPGCARVLASASRVLRVR